MSFQSVLNSPQVELVPGSGFSALRILELICKVWNPSGGRAATVHKVMCDYLGNIMSGVSDPETRAAFCDAVTGEGFDSELDEMLADAIAYAAAEVLGTIGDGVGLIGTNCVVNCTTSGASVDVGNLVQSVVELAMSSYSGDGVDWGNLAKGIGDIALTQVACCVISAGASMAARASVVKLKRPISAILGKFREACKELVVAEEGGSSSSPGWAQEPGTSTPSTPIRLTPGSTIFRKPSLILVPLKKPLEPPSATPRTSEDNKNWLPLAVTIAATGAASILIARRRARPRRR